MEIRLQEITDSSATIAWEPEDGAECYRVYWADSDTPSMEYCRLAEERIKKVSGDKKIGEGCV